MEILLVSVGSRAEGDSTGQLVDSLIHAGAGRAEPWRVAATVAGVDEPLGHLDGRRLVIDADLAGLNLTLSRLMRAGLLQTVDTAVIPREPVPYLNRIGLPRELAGQLRAAVEGVPRLVGVLKDDSGGLCVDGARVEPWPDASPDRATPGGATPVEGARSGWWLRAVVDDQRLADGAARAVEVRRLGPSELEATVQTGRFRRRSLRGRSLQLACDPAGIIQDGIARERPRSKRTFWSEPELWRLAL